MAKKVVLIDDINGELIDEGLGQTVEFTVHGTHYTLDLGVKNLDAFNKDLKKWIDAATEVESPRRSAASSTTKRRAPSGSGRPPEELAAIREWLTKEGHQVSERGRIKGELIQLFDDAHQAAST